MTVEQVTGPPRFDSGAFADFYRRHHRTVLLVLLSRGVTRHDAEDITHDVLLNVWPHRHTLTDPDRERTYVLASAHNRFRDLYRQVALHARPIGLAPDLPAATMPGPELRVLSDARDRALWEALARLAPRDRQLIIDTDIHEFTDDELAAIYRCEPNALRQRRWRIRQTLRVWLAPERTPTPVPVLLARRLAAAARAAGRTVHDAIAAIFTHPQPIAVLITTLTMVAAPFNGPLGQLPPAAAAEPPAWSRPTQPIVIGPQMPDPPGPMPTTDTARSHTLTWPRSPRQITARLLSIAPNDERTPPVPTVCVGADCVNQDVVTAHLPEPIGDQYVGTNAAAVCSLANQAPDVEAVSCQTQGDPEYRVPPRQPAF